MSSQHRKNPTTVSITFGVSCPVKGESQDYIKGETAAKVLIDDTALILGTLFTSHLAYSFLSSRSLLFLNYMANLATQFIVILIGLSNPTGL